MDEPHQRFPGSIQVGDEQLARLITAGSDRAFSTLYERYHKLLYRYCRSILRSEADAHDATQSALTRALEALRRDQRDAPLRPWLFRIAHNESISMLRRHKTARELSSGLGRLSVAVDDRVTHREQVGLLLDDLQELAPRQRGAIVMRELGGLSHEEIAEALGLSVNGARQAIFEARSALNDFAEGRAMACADVRQEIAEGDRRVMRRRSIRAHLRDCAVCSTFVSSLAPRRVRLRALAAPFIGLPARLSARLLASGSGRITGASSAGGSFLTNGVSNLDGALITAKSIGALAVGLTAAAGTGTLIYGLSEPSGARPPALNAPVARAAPASIQAFVVPAAAQAAGGRVATPTGARGMAPLIRFVPAAAVQALERVGAAGQPSDPRVKFVATLGNKPASQLTTGPSTSTSAPATQNGSTGSGSGSSGQAPVPTESGPEQGQTGATGSSGATSGQAGATGPAGQQPTPSSQAGGNSNGQGSGNSNGQGNGNANGQGNGNANGQGNGNANGQGNGIGVDNTNAHGSGNENGQGNGSAVEPPGLAGSGGGNGNPGNRSHGD